MKNILACTAVVMGIAAGACSSTPPVTATEACTDLANAVCGKVSGCAVTAFTEIYGDVSTCASRSAAACEKSLALTNTGDTPDFAESCSKGYANLSCNGALQNGPPTECTRTKFGTVTDGSACGADGQCTSGSCQIDGTTGCGTCIEPAASGGACKSTSDCKAGLVCALTATSTTTCVTPAGSGQACSTAVPIAPCQAGLLCVNSTCTAPLAAGSACDPKNPLCDTENGYWCTPVGTRCVAILYAGAGQTCGYNATTGDLTACSGGGSGGGASGACMNVDSKTLQGTCAGAAADGAACDTSKGPFCTPPALCINATCTVIDPATCL